MKKEIKQTKEAIKLAKKEIEEWTKFLKLAERKLKDSKNKAPQSDLRLLKKRS